YVNHATGDSQKSVEYYQPAGPAFAAVRALPGDLYSIIGMGEPLKAEKNYKRRLPLYQEVWLLGRRPNDPVVVASAFAHTASAYEGEGKLAQAETFYRRSLKAYRAVDHVYGEIHTLIRMGHLQISQGKYLDAIASLEQADALNG